jgi:hypothetical protein
MSRAMRAAAQAARDEALERLAAEAKQAIEQIQERGAAGTTELRRRADDDVAATREWSKAEIARIREETDRRIADRKAQLEADVERYAASIKRRTELVSESVARHDAELAAFIDRLTAEEDPARIATLAQELPEPPVLDASDLGDVGAEALEDGAGPAEARPAARDRERGAKSPSSIAAPAEADAEVDEAATDERGANTAANAVSGPDGERQGMDPRAGSVSDGSEAEATQDEPRLSAAGAAAAEAEALSGLDDTDPAGVRVDRSAVPAGGVDRTQLLVSGLSSVAGIAGFKRELSRLPGVRSVGVSAGEAGQFVFAVSHDPGVDLGSGIQTIAAFEPRLTGQHTGSLVVTASEPAAAE